MKKTASILSLVLLLTLTACVHDHPEGEGNREIRLEWQSAYPGELAEIHLWIFGSDGVLAGSETFATLDDARAARLTLPGGTCTLVAATCPASHYSFTAKPGETTPDRLTITLNDPSSNPPHIQSGVVTVPPQAQTATVILVRVLSELQFTIKNVPPEVIRVSATVLNCARGFCPGVNRLEDVPVTASLGEVVPADGQAVFPLRRLMPVVPAAEVRAAAEAAYDTRMEVEMTYAGGETLTFQVEAPPMKNNGSYNPTAGYEQFTKDVVLTLTDINGWGTSDTVEGEIEM